MIKRGLGKGLGALLSQYDQENDKSYEKFSNIDAKNEKNEKIADKNDNFLKKSAEITKLVNLNEIYPNPNQPRKSFDAETLNELAESIKVHGLIQPIIVNNEDNGYMIIAGERRYKAAKIAGLKEIPVIIKNYTAKQISEISIIENLQREDLNSIEVARGIKKLMLEYGLTQEKVSERLGKNRSVIANYIRILNLDNAVQKLIENGKVSFGHAKCLVAVDNINTQVYLANKVAKDKLTVRDLEKTIQNLKKTNKKDITPKPLSIELRELVNTMQRKFGTKVSIIGNDKKGRIYIDYYEQADLDRIYEIINKK